MASRKIDGVPPSPHAPGSSPEKPAVVHSSFLHEGFQDFQALMSSQEVSKWLARLSIDLQSTFGNQGPNMLDRLELGRRVHAIVAQAGFLGFSDLSQRCGALAEACHTEEDLSSPFEKAKLAAEAARRQINTLGQGE